MYKVKHNKTVRTFQLLDILYTNIFRCNRYSSLLTAGDNWCTWSGHLGTQLIHLKRSPWDATDTLEAVTLGRNWYNFLAAGRNSYFPDKISFLTDQKDFDVVIPVKYINRNRTFRYLKRTVRVRDRWQRDQGSMSVVVKISLYMKVPEFTFAGRKDVRNGEE